MIAKRERTIEEYKKLGAMFRLYKSLGSELLMQASKLLPTADCKILAKAMSRIDTIRAGAVAEMLSDHRNLTTKYFSVFYGDMREPTDSFDEEIISLAKQEFNVLFGENRRA